MAAETRHAGLTADERSDIRSTVLDTRELIEDDLYRQLERYGVYEDERVDLEQLGHLDAYDRQTRRTIDAALDRELEATEGDYQRSVENYVRESTKTYLNRLVALKAIEVRGLVTETLMERPEYGNRSEMLRTVDEVAGELTDQQDGGQSTALELAYTELTDEIGVIFEESEHTAINLDFAVREEVIEQLNEIDESVWESDEAMGWVYQYFGEKEREEIDDRIDEENYKVQDTDIATKTQLFTPRYIVEWLVDNSLGRLWLEMKGERTRINDEDNCFYLAPLEDSIIEREGKEVRDIQVLDPACGSGHMLSYAFDILYEMYLEEGDIAEKYIPREILRQNLYGIDIDPGAAQLAALTLYVKAKKIEPDIKIDQINIVSADAVLMDGEKKGEVLGRAESDLEKRVLEQVWERFQHVREWGSLIRIEKEIEEIIEEESENISSTGQAQFTKDGKLAKQSSVISFSDAAEEPWAAIKERILDNVTESVKESVEEDSTIEDLFTEEVEKSINIVDLFLEKYDIVISNPPYLSSTKMEGDLKTFVKDNYIGSKNLYSAFIERCLEFSCEKGIVSMVTPDSFMYLYGQRKLRSHLLNESQILDGVHLARYGFDNQKDRYVIPFTLMKHGSGSLSRFFRMTQDQDEYSNFSEKVAGLENITNTLRNGSSHRDVYTVNQDSFKKIGRQPFLYWFGQEILDLFVDHKNIGEIGDVKVGLQTSNDDRFVRRWWEISKDEIGEKYHWYVLGGDDNTYYDSAESTILWEDDGEEVKNYEKSYPRNVDYYGLEGVNFRKFSKVFTARYQPEGQIFSDATRFVYIDEADNESMLGYLCSSLTRFIMNGLNPSLNFQAGDAERLPIKEDSMDNEQISSIVQHAIDARKRQFSLMETKNEFNGQNLIQNAKEINYLIEKLEAEIEMKHGIIDSIIFEKYDIPEETIEVIYEDLPKNLIKYEHIENVGSLPTQEDADIINTKSISKEDYNSLIDGVESFDSEEIREISEEFEISPLTVAMIRHEHNLYSRDTEQKSAGRLLSYFLGEVFGRWNDLTSIEAESDGILVFDDQFNNDVETRIRECIDAAFENVYEYESYIEDSLNKEYPVWLKENFFRYHHCKEYRRRGQRIPIYWHLESEGGAFSCFIYYHSIDSDTFSKLRGMYIDKKLDTLQNRLETIESQLETADDDQARSLRSEKEEIEAEINDITGFRERVDELINENFKPDFEAGIWKNIQKVDEHGLLAVPLDKL